MMKLLVLNKGLFAKVSNKDYSRVKNFTWFSVKKHGKIYAARTDYLPEARKKGLPFCRRVYLHRAIVETFAVHIDHRNGDGLDCQRRNLRPCTAAQNQGNRVCRNRNNTSGFRGVVWSKRKGCWVSQIMIAGKGVFLGHYKNAISAAKAYDAKVRKIRGSFARVNFP